MPKKSVCSPDPLVYVACYNRFNNLAHAPKGTPAESSIYVYRLHRSTGTLTLLHKNNDSENPAFFRHHPNRNIVYACTEDITKDNEVCAWSISPTTGEMHLVSRQGAGGKSTCYLTIDHMNKHMLFVNYWDSVIGTLPMTPEGLLEPIKNKLQPPKSVVARDISDHLHNRQSEPHAHAIILDPYFGRVAYVPDLGEDDIKQYVYCEREGKLATTMTISCGPENLKPHGPRYIEFHPFFNTVYVVNELSSTVSVFVFNAVEAQSLQPGSKTSTLKFIQSISTIPTAFQRVHNTCGRICVDPEGRYVFVSNRGHDSIAVYKIDDDSSSCGEGGKLSIVSYCHTRGRTPRHFQYDPSGGYLIAANQDTDTITLFKFNKETGELVYTGETYRIPSPNFVSIKAPCTGERRSVAPKL